MTRLFKTFVFALLCALFSLAHALTVRVTDRDLQGLLGQGESQGGKLTLQLLAGASGPVTVFINDGNSITSYPGVVQDGQITLDKSAGGQLTKLLSDRGLTLSIMTVPAINDRSISLPGLQPQNGKKKDANGSITDQVKDQVKDKLNSLPANPAKSKP